MVTRGDTVLDYLEKELTDDERRKVIRYMKQYKKIDAIIESKKLDLMPSHTSKYNLAKSQHTNDFHSEVEEYTEKVEEVIEKYETIKKKLDNAYNAVNPIQKLIWDEHFIDGRRDADIYYGEDITKRTYYNEKNELILIVSECLSIGTKTHQKRTKNAPTDE